MEVALLLKDWLAAEGVTLSGFGERIGRSAEAVRRYVAGDRIPDRETMPRIVEHTAGQVTANDFFGIGDPEHGSGYAAPHGEQSSGSFDAASQRSVPAV